MKTIVDIKSVVPRFAHFAFKDPISWRIHEGENWAVIGPNGAGKSVLINILLGKHALKSGEITYMDSNGEKARVNDIVRCVSFKDIYSIIDTQNSYYQQRWNAGDEQNVAVVKDLVKDADSNILDALVKWFGISDLMEKSINLLSSGELRKFLIVKVLLARPRILILDNPFIGLDAPSRKILTDLFDKLAKFDNLQIVLVISNPADIPDIITHVLPLSGMQFHPFCSKSEFMKDEVLKSTLFRTSGDLNLKSIKSESKFKAENFDFENAAILRKATIKYGTRIILNELDWIVKRGEKWALLGPNGSGKSTLLSLICADNPQAYSNDITLFDRKRGSGESIWEIKKRIGYISPEMHLYYLKNVRCVDVVGSGFFDTVGLYRKCNAEQERVAENWMDIFGVKALKDISFLNVSTGEQRLVLLARVFVKNPDLLILDEPLHGLDVENKKRVKSIIEAYCGKDKSLIYVTHYDHEIPDVVDKRLVLSKNY